MTNRTRALRALLLVGALLGAACGDDSTVGSDELRAGGGGEDRLALGETTTTTTTPDPGAPVDTTAPPPSTPPPTAPPATAPPPTAPPPTAPPAQSFTLQIEIRSDASSPQMNPSVARVFAGSTIRWINADSVPRSVEAADGSFASGLIAPGAVFDHFFGAAGTFGYKDGTRPYVTAQVEVLAR